MTSEEKPMQSTGDVQGFKGEFRFLSNFFPAPVFIASYPWPSVEHAYQALKTVDPAERDRVAQAETPGQAKRLGDELTVRADWAEVRVPLMKLCVRSKFIQHGQLAARLLATGQALLIEDNHWGDHFWGVCDGEGENQLGRILMEVRAEISPLA